MIVIGRIFWLPVKIHSKRFEKQFTIENKEINAICPNDNEPKRKL
jgi:hypothetical protein